MIRPLVAFTFTLALLLGVASPSFGALTAQTDRGVIDENDVLRLTLRIDEQVFIGEPDFSPLEQDFVIMGQQRASQFTLVNGQTESETTWTLTLQPKRRGTLQIPALEFKGQSSEPLRVRVTAPSAEAQEALRALVFMESTVSANSAYVQEQLTLTATLWYAAGAVLFGDFPPPPRIPDVLVHPLGDAEPGREERDGRRYNTITQRYALIPQRSGLLRLPPQSFSGAVRVPEGGRTRRKNLRAQTPRHELTIKPVPASWPDGSAWLPARDLTLTVSYAPGLADSEVGIPTEQRIVLEALAVAASTLPPLSAPSGPGLRSYDSQRTLEEAPEDRPTARWLRSRQTLRTLLMPEASGPLEIPALSLPWWDTQSDSLRYATLPGERFRARPGSATPPPLSRTQAGPEPRFGSDRAAQPPSEPEALVPEDANEAPPAPAPLGPSPTLLALGITLLGILGAVLYAWRRQAADKEDRPPTGPEPNAIAALRQAVQARDGRAAYQALLRWQREGGTDTAPEAVVQDAIKALSTLGRTLFCAGEQAGGVDTAIDFNALRRLSQRLGQRPRKARTPALPPLYPEGS